MIWIFGRDCGRRGEDPVLARPGEGDGCALPRAPPAAIDLPEVLASAVGPELGRAHPSAVHFGLGRELLKVKTVWVVPKANTAMARILTPNTNVGVTIIRRNEPPPQAR